MSYIQSLHHIIIRSKYSANVLTNKYVNELYSYIWGYIIKKKSVLYQINGMPDHLHLLVSIHSTISLANFVKELKTSSNFWLKSHEEKFPYFQSWGEQYAAFSVRYQEKDKLVEYIKNQKEHHKRENFRDEYRRFIEMNGISIDEKFFLSDC